MVKFAKALVLRRFKSLLRNTYVAHSHLADLDHLQPAATAVAACSEPLLFWQYHIIWSNTFGAPVLYFNANRAGTHSSIFLSPRLKMDRY